MGRPKVAERLAGVGGQDEGLLLGLQALADPIRLHIVRLLAEREQCVCHLTDSFGLSQASISHHMAILKRAGLVEVRRDARWTYYRLAPEAVLCLRQSVDGLLEVGAAVLAPADCCVSAEDRARSPESSDQDVSAPIPLAMPSDSTTSRATLSQATHTQWRCH